MRLIMPKSFRNGTLIHDFGYVEPIERRNPAATADGDAEWNARKESASQLKRRLRALHREVPTPCSDRERDAMRRAAELRKAG